MARGRCIYGEFPTLDLTGTVNYKRQGAIFIFDFDAKAAKIVLALTQAQIDAEVREERLFEVNDDAQDL